MLKPLHLITLREVCRTGSFALAARALGYTASAVSQQISALEKDTGLVLFEREAHGIRATAAAHRLASLSKSVLASLQDLEYETRRLADGTTGRLRVGSFPTASVGLVPPALSGFTGLRPDAEVTLEEGEPDDLLAGLSEGDLDLALVYEYALGPRQWPADLTVRRLLREDLLLLTPRRRPLGGGLSACAGERWIASGEETAGSRSLTGLCAAAGFTPAIAFRSNNYDVVRRLVASGLGVAVVPALGHVPDAEVLATPLATASASRTVITLHRQANDNPLLGDALAMFRRAIPRNLPHTTLLG